jgi:endonuclease/exonuclease/phosphatase family metal-dependent hydrolase
LGYYRFFSIVSVHALSSFDIVYIEHSTLKKEKTQRMTRIVSYNILAGGYNLRENCTKRVHQLTAIIRSANPDVVGLVEATHPLLMQKPLVIEELAEALDMQLVMGGPAAHSTDYQTALLTRLPVIYSRIHVHPGVLNKPLLEVCVEESDGQQLTIFVTHLSAAFYKGWAGSHLRNRESEEILRITAPLREQGKPHLIMGDFNSLAPDDPFKASHLIRYVVGLDQSRPEKAIAMQDGNPYLEFVVPPRLRFLNPLLRTIPRSRILCSLFDAAATFYAPRGCIRKLLDAGYVDSFRYVNPRTWGFTCPAAAPAGRIDFIFASPPLAQRLEACYEITQGEGVSGSQASDHLAVAAEFGVKVQPDPSSEELDLDSAMTH